MLAYVAIWSNHTTVPILNHFLGVLPHVILWLIGQSICFATKVQVDPTATRNSVPGTSLFHKSTCLVEQEQHAECCGDIHFATVSHLGLQRVHPIWSREMDSIYEHIRWWVNQSWQVSIWNCEKHLFSGTGWGYLYLYLSIYIYIYIYISFIYIYMFIHLLHFDFGKHPAWVGYV